MAQAFTRRQSALRLLGALLLVSAAGLWIASGGGVLAWLSIAFFVLAGCGWAWLAVTGRPNVAWLQPEEERIELEPEGFAVVTMRGRRFPVRWAGVRRVSAYKRDLVTTDEICVLFESDEPEGAREVSEEWPGFQDLLGAMTAGLGIGPAWYTEIMSPAFESNPRVLFDRAGGAASARGAMELVRPCRYSARRGAARLRRSVRRGGGHASQVRGRRARLFRPVRSGRGDERHGDRGG